MQRLLIRQKHIYTAFICLIVFCSLRCFYLVGEDSRILDLTVLLEILFFGYVYCTCSGKRGRHWWLFLIPVLLAATSSLSALRSYGQPFLLGFRAQRHWIVAMLMYFPLTRLFNSGKLKVDDFLDALESIILIYMLLVLVQYVLGTRFWILKIHHYHRYGSIRLYADLCFVEIIYFRHLLKALSDRHMHIKDLFFIIATLFFHLFITKSRMALVALLGASGLAFLIQKTTKKKILLFGAVLILLGVLLGSEIGKGLLTTAVSVITNTENPEGTVGIRIIGRAYYMENTLSDPVKMIFGCGFANIDWPESVVGSGIGDYIYYVDQGIYGMFFYYGLVFVIWMAVLYFVVLKDGWKVRCMDCCFYLLYSLLGIYTLLPGCYAGTISFVLPAAIVSHTLQKMEAPDRKCLLFEKGRG